MVSNVSFTYLHVVSIHYDEGLYHEIYGYVRSGLSTHVLYVYVYNIHMYVQYA